MASCACRLSLASFTCFPGVKTGLMDSAAALFDSWPAVTSVTSCGTREGDIAVSQLRKGRLWGAGLLPRPRSGRLPPLPPAPAVPSAAPTWPCQVDCGVPAAPQHSPPLPGRASPGNLPSRHSASLHPRLPAGLLHSSFSLFFSCPHCPRGLCPRSLSGLQPGPQLPEALPHYGHSSCGRPAAPRSVGSSLPSGSLPHTPAL